MNATPEAFDRLQSDCEDKWETIQQQRRRLQALEMHIDGYQLQLSRILESLKSLPGDHEAAKARIAEMVAGIEANETEVRGPFLTSEVFNDGLRVKIHRTAENDFTIYVGDKLADRLCWDECLGLLCSLLIPDKRRNLCWLRTAEQHDTDAAERDARIKLREYHSKMEAIR